MIFSKPKTEKPTHRRKEAGAAMVEAAIAFPVFFLMLFGIIEFGFLMRSTITLQNAVVDGARSASIAGSHPTADFQILNAIYHGLQPQGRKNVDTIIVYEASSPSEPVPVACLSGTNLRKARCNRYGSADLFKPLYNTDGTRTQHWGCGPAAEDNHWCPMDRNSSVRKAAGPSYVGIYIRLKHEYLTGFIGRDFFLERHRVVRLEPTV